MIYISIYLHFFLSVVEAKHSLEERDQGLVQVRRAERVEPLQVPAMASSLSHCHHSEVVASALRLWKLPAGTIIPMTIKASCEGSHGQTLR